MLSQWRQWQPSIPTAIFRVSEDKLVLQLLNLCCHSLAKAQALMDDAGLILNPDEASAPWLKFPLLDLISYPKFIEGHVWVPPSADHLWRFYHGVLVQITRASISLQLPTGDANIPIKNCLLWYVHKCTYLNMNITFWMERNYLYQWPSLMHCPLRKFHGCCTNTFGQLNSWRRGVGVIQWWLSKWGRSTTICGMLPWMCRLQGWTHGFTTYGQMKSF